MHTDRREVIGWSSRLSAAGDGQRYASCGDCHAHRDRSTRFRHHWVQAWNSHDLDTILSHYAADVILVSPVAAKLLDDPSGKVVGMEVLRAYFTRGIESYSELLIGAF